VRHLERSGEIGEEDRARLQRRDEERLLPLVVLGEESSQLSYADGDLLAGEEDLPDAPVLRRIYEASLSWNR
jgi:hypothetical protein